MQRSYNLRTIAATGTAQPVVGTTLTAAVAAGIPAPQLLAVADSTVFDQGHSALVDVGALEERVLVMSIPDGTHINVQGEVQGLGCRLAHAINAIIRPGRQINSLYVQPTDGNTAPMWVGTGPTLTVGGVAALKKLLQVAAGTQPPDFKAEFASGSGPNSMELSEFWIVGTNPNTYLASAGII